MGLPRKHLMAPQVTLEKKKRVGLFEPHQLGSPKIGSADPMDLEPFANNLITSFPGGQ